MTKMFFGNDHCVGVTSGLTGREYNADKQGFIHVNDPRDAKFLKEGGYIVAGAMPKVSKYWVCDDCNFHAVFNHCPKCDSTNLVKVVR